MAVSREWEKAAAEWDAACGTIGPEQQQQQQQQRAKRTVAADNTRAAKRARAGTMVPGVLKLDHELRPLWVCADGTILMERFNRYYQQAYDFLVAVAEPVCRPRNIHEYRLTKNSLYAAAAVGLDTGTIVGVLSKLSKMELNDQLASWITKCTRSFGKAKLVLHHSCHWIESDSCDVLGELLTDELIAAARGQLSPVESAGQPGATASRGCDSSSELDQIEREWELCGPDATSAHAHVKANPTQSDTLGAPQQSSLQVDGAAYLERLADGGVNDIGEIAAPWEMATHSANRKVFKFALRRGTAEAVKQRCIERQTPLLEEYDFRHDSDNPPLRIEAKPLVQLRDYQVAQVCCSSHPRCLVLMNSNRLSAGASTDAQEKSLKQMFSTGRARSGVIVLPCGAGKTLTGLMAAVTIKKSTLVLCVNTSSVEQWREHFVRFTTMEYKHTHVVLSPCML